MTRERDLRPLLDEWFADGPDRASDRVLDVVIDRLERQSQRPAWHLTGRPGPMNAPLKIAAAIAAVVVVAVIGFNLLPASTPQVGGPLSTATPTPSPAPTVGSSAAASPSSPAYTWPAGLAAGTYTTSLLWQLPFELTFTVPDGWESRDVEIIKDPVTSLAVNLVGNVYSDPCGTTPKEPALGPSVADLVTAIQSMPGLDVTTPTPVQFDRRTNGMYLEFDLRDDAPCGVGTYRLWLDPDGVYKPDVPKGGPYWTVERAHNRLWILDVGGVRLVISALSSADASAADLAELQSIVDSLSIVYPDSTPPPEPSSP
jgi:hypothetical protein